jgi:acetyltransferase-like isoleucine patch superfamily enzyme
MKPYILFVYKFLVLFMPDTKFFSLKSRILRIAGAEIGSNVRICSSATILGNGTLVIGDNTWIGHQSLLISSSSIIIGANVDIAPKVYLGTGTHVIDAKSDNVAGEGLSKDIVIEDGCWLGISAIVLPGVTIGFKSVIAAGSVVSKNTESFCIYGGVPAKLIKKIESR